MVFFFYSPRPKLIQPADQNGTRERTGVSTLRHGACFTKWTAASVHVIKECVLEEGEGVAVRGGMYLNMSAWHRVRSGPAGREWAL